MLFFFSFSPTVVPDMEKAGLKSHFSSDLPVPLIAERIDLIRKLSKIFIRHALTFFNNGNETFSRNHQAVKRAGFLHGKHPVSFFSTSCLLPCAICSPVSRSYASPLWELKHQIPTSFLTCSANSTAVVSSPCTINTFFGGFLKFAIHAVR